MSIQERVESKNGSASGETANRKNLAIGALTALRIVYGDIGTSPLYAFKVAVRAASGSTLSVPIGVASLILWSLVLVVSIKYALLIMRADNRGEGGVVTMLALLGTRHATPHSRQAEPYSCLDWSALRSFTGTERSRPRSLS